MNLGDGLVFFKEPQLAIIHIYLSYIIIHVSIMVKLANRHV